MPLDGRYHEGWRFARLCVDQGTPQGCPRSSRKQRLTASQYPQKKPGQGSRTRASTRGVEQPVRGLAAAGAGEDGAVEWVELVQEPG